MVASTARDTMSSTFLTFRDVGCVKVRCIVVVPSPTW